MTRPSLKFSRFSIAVAASIVSFTMGTNFARAAEVDAADRGLKPVVRIRGGPSFENNGGNTGPAWFGGGSAGVLIQRTAIVTVGIDRISLDEFRVATPVMLQLEVSRPFRIPVTPRLLAGLGPWFLQAVQTYDVDFFGTPPPGVSHRTYTLLGGYLGSGLSFRVLKSAMFDIGLRYQAAHNEGGTMHLITTDAGFTFRL